MNSNLPIFTWIARAIVLFTAMPIHECAHGYAAYKLGDDTAHRQGRLTLNPLPHLDPLGSLLLIFAGFGWAKPVEVNPRNFRHPRWGMALTSLAGPLSNVLLALVILVVYKIFWVFVPVYRTSTVVYVLVTLMSAMINTNLYLAVFNLLPVPPLDGAKIFGAILPDRVYFTIMRYERYIALLVVVLVFTGVFTPLLDAAAGLLYHVLDFLTRPVDWLL